LAETLLQKVVAASLGDWTFPTEAVSRDVQVAVEFKPPTSLAPSVEK
jgi:hypothetical protein